MHPVLYYYDNGIPPLEQFLTLARPKRLHHMVEDFLTEWYGSLEKELLFVLCKAVAGGKPIEALCLSRYFL